MWLQYRAVQQGCIRVPPLLMSCVPATAVRQVSRGCAVTAGSVNYSEAGKVLSTTRDPPALLRGRIDL